MPALDFPASSASPYTAPNGVVYTWNDNGYWEADTDGSSVDTEYLKLDASNGPVTGPLTFEGQTTHEGGVSVTDVSSFEISDSNPGITQTFNNCPYGTIQYFKPTGATRTEQMSSYVRILHDDGGDKDLDTGKLSCFYGQIRNTTPFNFTRDATVSCYDNILYADNIKAAAGSTVTVSGYRSNVPVSTETGVTNYNFYAAGDAPNYFAGNALFKGGTTTDTAKIVIGNSASGTPQLYLQRTGDATGAAAIRVKASNASSDAFNVSYNGSAYFAGGVFQSNAPDGNNYVSMSGGILRCQKYSNTTSHFAAQFIRSRNDSNPMGSEVFIRFGAGAADTQAALIRMDGAGAAIFDSTSDYRAKENIVDLPSAVDSIKALRPVNFNYTWAPGKTRPGFVAHELASALPVAVVGEKDETEAIGTLADYNGTVLETEVTEPSAEELEYTVEVETDGVATMVTRTRTWTPSGTRPVYQGVDQTKLIPLLTKALQEALEKIETLETRLDALEGA